MQKIFCDSDDKVEDYLKLLEGEELIACDTETNGFSPYTNKLWSVQFGDINETVAILFPYHALNENSRKLLRKFTADKVIIAHNAKFDYKFLYINGFDIKGTYCTMEAEKTLFAGKYFTFGLKDVLLRRFQIQMDKEVRAVFYSTDPNEVSEFQHRIDAAGGDEWAAWDEETIEYALDDIIYLPEIYHDQQKDAKELGMNNIHWLENKLVPVVGDMENRGVGLDVAATKKFHSKVSKRRDELNLELFGTLEKSYNISWQREYATRMKLWDSWKSTHEPIVAASNKLRVEGDKRKKTQEALDMVQASLKKQPFASKPKPDSPFSSTSPTKLKMALEEVTGLIIPTTGKEWLEENIHLHPAIADLTEFRKYDKLCQFCELVNDINPKTGKIHADFNQNGTKSGRFSCSNPNLQQIPARTDEAKEFRGLFRPKEGHKFVGADLAGIELVIIAYFSKEQVLIDAINRGDDVHCFSMGGLLSCDYSALVHAKKVSDDDLSKEETLAIQIARDDFHLTFNMPELEKKATLHEWVATLRDYTKTITYGLAYGLSAYGLSRKFHCSYEDAELFISKFFGLYPNIKKFLNVEEDLGIKRLYAVNPLGRRRWFTYPRKKTYEMVEKEVIKALDKQKRLWDSVEDDEWEALMTEALKLAEKEHRGKINSIKRQAGNFFPQSMCADMIKLAMVKFGHKFVGSSNDEGLILQIHDELIAEVLEENVEEASKVLDEAMVYAVTKFMPEIITKVEVKVMDRWEK